jgi:outer membrane protein insertion porin family
LARPIPAPAVGVAVASEPAVGARVVSVEVVGNAHVAVAAVDAAIASKVGEPFSEAQVERDREAIRRLGWFQRVEAVRESLENGVRVTFRVVENPVITDIQFEGIRALTRDQLLAVMQTTPGSVYNLQMLAKDAQLIENLYRKQGYTLAMVVSALDLTPEGVLTIRIAEGVIEDVKITGNTRTNTAVIRRYISTQPGDTYSLPKVSRDVARLAATDYFETVRHDAEVGSEPGQVVLIFIVAEKKRTGQMTLGGGYSTDQGITGTIGLTRSNIRGSGQAVTVKKDFGGSNSYELSYRNPWAASPETGLDLGIYNRLVQREVVVNTSEGEQRSLSYDEHRVGGSLTLGRPVSDRTTVYARLRRDDVSIADLSEADQQLLTGSSFAAREVRSLTLSGVSDSRDDRRNPRNGSYHQVSLEFAGIFGGTHFDKYTLDTRRYLGIGNRSIIAMRLLAGAVTGDVPYLESFLIGGSSSLRGYRSDRFVGSRMAVLNTEYRIPLGGNVVGVVFFDVGDAWGGSLAASSSLGGSGSFSAHIGYGAGVRVKTPLGPVRLDLGFSRDGAETHFGMSQMF